MTRSTGPNPSADPPARANRLAGETSPYLRQHAHNPVDWYPWGPEALELARRTGKPILLSIGYAACHWCHVMAHESFEDPATAQRMNELYVNIKVDREERPDLDRLYQIAQQMLTGRNGGWPLTMFLLPEDQRPFFAGTYFPPQPRHGMPAFITVLEELAAYCREHPDEVRRPAGAVARALAQLNPPPSADAELDRQPLHACRARLERSFDGEWGGFGDAPKFPHPRTLLRLLRDWYASAQATAPDLQALYMSTLTLTRMAEGGLFDQVGGGFYRYSVDERWAIPHFEKMLYDNAELLAAYAEAHRATGEPLFADIATRTAGWLLGEMRAPEGGFFCSLDADSEGHEGLFYVWDEAGLRQLLTPAEYAAWALRFGLEGTPNFEGRWHFSVRRPLAEVATTLERDEYQLGAQLDVARGKLLAARAARARPGLDDKRLTSWNALAIRGLAIAANCLDRPDWAEAAGQALAWLRAHHWRTGRLLATSAGGEARLDAYLDDYVFLADAILELASVRFDAGELRFAGELMDAVLAHFTDTDAGGFFFTADDHEPLIARPKGFGDDALPSGNAVAVDVLLRLGSLLGETRYLQAAEGALRAAWPGLQQHPHGHSTLLNALELYLESPQIVVLRGPLAVIEPWRRQLAQVHAPQRWVLAIDSAAADLPAALAAKTPRPQGVAYLCRGTRCLPALDNLEELAAALRS